MAPEIMTGLTRIQKSNPEAHAVPMYEAVVQSIPTLGDPASIRPGSKLTSWIILSLGPRTPQPTPPIPASQSSTSNPYFKETTKPSPAHSPPSPIQPQQSQQPPTPSPPLQPNGLPESNTHYELLKQDQHEPQYRQKQHLLTLQPTST